MDPEDLVERYVDALEAGNLEAVLGLFAEGAEVTSPLQGTRPAEAFYGELLESTERSRVDVLGVFEAPDGDVAADLRYDWRLAGGDEHVFTCVDVLRRAEDGRIRELRIYYDPGDVREAYDEASGD